jgi:hypothetical protein
MRSTTISERLRASVAAGDYAELQLLLVEYGADVATQWRAASEDERRVIARESTSLLEWVKHSILAARAHAQLSHVESVRQRVYATTAASRSSVEIDA